MSARRTSSEKGAAPHARSSSVSTTDLALPTGCDTPKPRRCALAARCRRGAARSDTRTEERLLLGDILDGLFGLTSRTPRAPNFGRRPAVHFNKDGVEPSQAPEARPHRDLGHWQAGLVEEPFGSLHARGPCHF